MSHKRTTISKTQKPRNSTHLIVRTVNSYIRSVTTFVSALKYNRRWTSSSIMQTDYRGASKRSLPHATSRGTPLKLTITVKSLIYIIIMITKTNIKNSFHQISSFIITDASLKYVIVILFPLLTHRS